MAEFWAWVDSWPIGYFMVIGMVALGLSYILDVIRDARGEWK